MSHVVRILLVGCLWAFLPGPAAAQIVNGNFEAGGLGWAGGGPVTWSFSFPPMGGNPNGHARIESPSTQSGGQTCITQQFICGDNPSGTTVCGISVQYLLDNLQAAMQSARVRILLDGVEQHVSPPADTIGWTTVAFSVPCGSHQIALCLQVDTGNNAWQARFDNATGDCTFVTPTRPSSWGAIKATYR
jgi:hypothetical protein